MEFNKILVAASGNGADEEAVKLACNLAKKLNCPKKSVQI